MRAKVQSISSSFLFNTDARKSTIEFAKKNQRNSINYTKGMAIAGSVILLLPPPPQLITMMI